MRNGRVSREGEESKKGGVQNWAQIVENWGRWK
jgi:hypothetical protein